MFSGSSRRNMDGGSLEADGYQSVSTDEEVMLPSGRINGIVLEQLGITAGTALWLTRLFGNSVEFRVDLQTRDELESAFEASSDGIDKVIRRMRHGKNRQVNA